MRAASAVRLPGGADWSAVKTARGYGLFLHPCRPTPAFRNRSALEGGASVELEGFRVITVTGGLSVCSLATLSRRAKRFALTGSLTDFKVTKL